MNNSAPTLCDRIMNIENLLRQGKIEVITGSMFSGKTEELLRRLKRVAIAKLRTEIFKPAIDTRFNEKALVSHDFNSTISTPIENSSAILPLCNNIDVIAIDEAQFFDSGLIDVCDALANKGIRVIVAGLDMDFMGKPFGPIPGLMAIADEVTKLHAICMQCGRPALNSFRLGSNTDQIILGEKELYEPRCRICFRLGK